MLKMFEIGSIFCTGHANVITLYNIYKYMYLSFLSKYGLVTISSNGT